MDESRRHRTAAAPPAFLPSDQVTSKTDYSRVLAAARCKEGVFSAQLLEEVRIRWEVFSATSPTRIARPTTPPGALRHALALAVAGKAVAEADRRGGAAAARNRKAVDEMGPSGPLVSTCGASERAPRLKRKQQGDGEGTDCPQRTRPKRRNTVGEDLFGSESDSGADEESDGQLDEGEDGGGPLVSATADDALACLAEPVSLDDQPDPSDARPSAGDVSGEGVAPSSRRREEGEERITCCCISICYPCSVTFSYFDADVNEASGHESRQLGDEEAVATSGALLAQQDGGGSGVNDAATEALISKIFDDDDDSTPVSPVSIAPRRKTNQQQRHQYKTKHHRDDFNQNRSQPHRGVAAAKASVEKLHRQRGLQAAESEPKSEVHDSGNLCDGQQREGTGRSGSSSRVRAQTAEFVKAILEPMYRAQLIDKAQFKVVVVRYRDGGGSR